MKLARAEQMRRIDLKTIEDIGIPGIILMENAGRGTVESITGFYGSVNKKKIAVFAGPGNNGGDGFVIARYLDQLGAKVVVFLLVDADKVKGDAAVHFRVIDNLGIPIRYIISEDDCRELQFDCYDLIVDALFGTGLKRSVEGHFFYTIERINKSNSPVIAVDIPSGVDSDTGVICGTAVHADLTVTFGLAKPGHFICPGREKAGTVKVVDIAIPNQIIVEEHFSYELLDKKFADKLIAPRALNVHKGTYGHLLTIAGSTGKTGAAILSCLGALRSGAGLVSLCAPQCLNAIYESALHEAMTVTIKGNNEGAPIIDDLQTITKMLAGKQAVVVGPGIGTAEKTAELVRHIYQHVDIPILCDADALNILAMKENSLKKGVNAARIITPHPGEMARLIGESASFVQKNRLQVAHKFAVTNNVYLVLKGAGSIIADPDGKIAINPSGNPGMAAGGMGDVLSGIIGGLLVQGFSPWQACCLGTYTHGLAADRLASKTPYGYLAGEVAETLPIIIHELLNNK